ncbi:hypothetical protein C1646_777582 [Rhizophagus diaphanus]|nr:hypothetical protein C1646_777582 [Rhizophagus diaphanus] [Rhizophagus sp. MUCL 43196]
MDNNILKLKVDPLLSHEDLPNYHSDDNWHTCGNNMELWLVEGAVKLVNPENIEHHIIVWLHNMPKPDEYNYYVQEIVYRFDGRWKYREIATRHRLPCENITLISSSQNLSTLKIFLDIYVDDFGTFRNVYHSLGGVYLQIGNMPSNLRKQLKNYFLIGFVPFGADFNDFIRPVIQDIKSLENGLIMQILYGDVYMDLNYNYVKNAHFQQQTNEHIVEIKSQSLKRDQDQLATEYRLIEPGSLNTLKWDQHIQTPQDPYHSMVGKAQTLLEVTFNIFNTNGENEFLKHWRIIEKPSYWSRMPNPTEALNKWQENLGIRRNLVVSNLQMCWTIEVKVFPEIFTNLPNFHVNIHLLQHTRNFATFTNIAVSIKEMALRHLIDGWTDPHFSTRPNALTKFTADPNIYKILTGWYATENSSNNNIAICCHDNNFVDIILINQWDAKKVNEMGLSKKLDDKHPFFRDLSISYMEHFKSNGMLLNRKLEFYNSISYTIIKKDQDSIQLKIHIGDIVELPKESEGNKCS